MQTHFKIIVPVYNAENWIGLCLRSAKFQTYQNFQCIIVDDLSTDNTKAVIEKEIKDLENFKLLIPEKKGYPLGSLNFALNNIIINDEDVIVILDGDDWFAKKESLSL